MQNYEYLDNFCIMIWKPKRLSYDCEDIYIGSKRSKDRKGHFNLFALIKNTY